MRLFLSITSALSLRRFLIGPLPTPSDLSVSPVPSSPSRFSQSGYIAETSPWTSQSFQII